MNQTKGNFKVILTFKYAFDLFYHDSGGTWEAKSHTVRNFNRSNTSVFRESISFIFSSIESFLNKFRKQLSSLEIHDFINFNVLDLATKFNGA